MAFDFVYQVIILKAVYKKANSLEKTLMLGKVHGRRGQKRMRWLGNITDPMDVDLSKLQEMVRTRTPGCSPGGHRVPCDIATEQ